MTTIALVESPAQLLNVLEWADGSESRDLRVMVLAPGDHPSGRQDQARRQLRTMSGLASAAGHTMQWHEPRSRPGAQLGVIRSITAQLWEADRLVLGDPFSGLMQLLLSVSRARQVVVVDDGSATFEFVELLEQGRDLVRWHRTGRSHPFASVARRRLAARPGRSVELFTALPISTNAITTVPSDYAWTRRQFGPPPVRPSGDLIGTSLVETGVVELPQYLRAVDVLAGNHQVTRYLAHRREGRDKLAEIEALGLEVIRPDLPLELWARIGPIGQTIVSFPSTIVHTLPIVLQGTGASLSFCDIENGWLTPQASARSGSFLSTVTSTARHTHGLASVAAA